jgi:pimeloyl-ACP methyl ester carboxylesterase
VTASGPPPAPPPFEPFRLELGGGQWLVGDELRGELPCHVFLHGLGSARAGEKSASLAIHAAGRGRACLRFDMRGHGESSGELGRVAVSELIADAVRVLEYTGPATVVGSSLGGLIGAWVAATRPDLVQHLALLAPALGLLPNLTDHHDAHGMMATDDGQCFRIDAHVLDDAQRLDEAALPARLTVPTLLVHGTADDVIPWQVSERFFAAMPSRRKQLWLVPGGDHRLNAVAALIWQRLDELTTP